MHLVLCISFYASHYMRLILTDQWTLSHIELLSQLKTGYQQVSNGKTDKEQVGELPEGLVRGDRHADQDVPQDGDHHHEDQQEGQQPGHQEGDLEIGKMNDKIKIFASAPSQILANKSCSSVDFVSSFDLIKNAEYSRTKVTPGEQSSIQHKG